MIQHWRVLILVVCVLSAIFAVGLKFYPYGRYGVEIAYISPDSPAKTLLKPGMQVTQVNGIEIKDLADWERAIQNLSGNVTIKADGKVYSFFVNQSLGIDAMELERTNLQFGLDIRGGTRILLKPEGNASQEQIREAVATLQTRANLYGLREISFRPVGAGDSWYVQIEAAGIAPEIIEDLLARQGTFEAKLIKPAKDQLIIGEKTWPIRLVNESVEVAGKLLQPNQSIQLDGYNLTFLNITQGRAIFLADLFGSNDIQLVYTDPQHSGVIPRGNYWMFYFAILVSDEGAKRFAELTQGIPKHLDINTGEEYLDSKLLLYLDNQLVSQLNIAGSLGGQYVQTAQIQGSRETREEAIQEKLRLQAILRSGALPVKFSFESIDIISPRLGPGFLTSAGLAGLLAAVAVGLIVFFRYRSPKLSLPMVGVVLSEICIILGIAAENDWPIWTLALIINCIILVLALWKKQEVDPLAWIGAILIPLLGLTSWTIDLPAIAGIIAAIGTGIDDQIIIADETIRKEKVYSLKEKIKRAFFIIFGSAATTIAAMVPLMFLGIGLVRGFAIMTIIGVLTGVLITRPAYAHLVELMKK